MRGTILQLLRSQSDGYLSGEELSRQLSVSRTAVWKHIRALKEAGYEIESHARKGYRLQQAPDRLLEGEIRNKLATRCFGQQGVLHLDEVDSTNNVAKQLANQDCPEGMLVVAEEQTLGRGRLSRAWFSPPGRGIWWSIVLRPPFAPQEAPKCTLMAAVAAVRAIRRATGVDCGIKWPNDILWQGRKLMGILTEMSAEMDAINYVVIGMGLNVNLRQDEFPHELQEIAVSLSMADGKPISRLAVLQALLLELEAAYDEVRQHGFAPLLNAWRELSVTLGQAVAVSGTGGGFNGIARDIDEDGALLVETEDGLRRVLAGDVSIRPQKKEE